MQYNIYPSRDATIYNVTINSQIVSSSNSGQSEILELLHLTKSLTDRGNSRALLYFDLTALSQSIAAGNIPSSSVQFRLNLKNAIHADEVPSSYDLVVYPLSRSWDEGRGLSDYDMGLKDRNQFVNWANSTSTTSWTVPGGDMITSISASQHFDFGTEDLDVDISNIVYAWLTGNVSNNGLMVRYQDAYESGTIDYAFKRFFSRHVKVPERKPVITSRWSKTLQDDRNNLKFNNSGSLFYYRFLNGNYDNLSPLYCNIVNASGSIVQTLTASRPAGTNGIHQISGVYIPYNSGSFVCRDVWFSGTTQYFTGTLSLQYFTGSKDLNFDQTTVDITNIKSFYTAGEKLNLRVFIKEKDYKPAVLSYANLDSSPLYLKNCYYEISNQKTGQVLIPFSTGSLQYSKLSYDEDGNYFEIWIDSLPKDNIYTIKVLAQNNNESYIFDKNWTLNVR